MVKMNDTNTLATITIEGQHNATQIENLIYELSKARAQMEPGVPFDYRLSEKDAIIGIHENPYFQIARLRDGTIRFWMRHSGIGWLCYTVPVDQARAARDYLIKNLPDSAGNPNLFSEDFPDRSRPN